MARKFLRSFFKSALKIYGKEFLVYNVHSLMHLADDSLSFGSLDNCGAFGFENFMQTLKRKLRTRNCHLQQIVNRLTEEENLGYQNKLSPNCLKENVIHTFNGVSYFVYKDTWFSNGNGNNCFLCCNSKYGFRLRLNVSNFIHPTYMSCL